ncbi:MAG: PilZ domain-containing protein [Spirochaetota bacterium]
MNEKRKHPRVSKKIKSEVHSSDGMTFSSSKDLSYGGIFISTPEPVNIGSEIQLSVIGPDEENIEIKGIVRWLSEGDGKNSPSGMGIEFIDINLNEKTKITKIVES